MSEKYVDVENFLRYYNRVLGWGANSLVIRLCGGNEFLFLCPSYCSRKSLRITRFRLTRHQWQTSHFSLFRPRADVAPLVTMFARREYNRARVKKGNEMKGK